MNTTTKIDIEATAQALIKAGYRRTSNKYKTVTRIDRADWQEVIRTQANPFILLDGAHAADHYRRCFSQDNIRLADTYTIEEAAAIYTLIPSSHDAVGFIHPDGTPDPGYEVRLVPRTTRRQSHEIGGCADLCGYCAVCRAAREEYTS